MTKPGPMKQVTGMANDYAGKRVFITGASSGIGAALAKELARRGARVALAARRADRLEDVGRAISEAGGMSLAVACDVTDRASLDHASEKGLAIGSINLIPKHNVPVTLRTDIPAAAPRAIPVVIEEEVPAEDTRRTRDLKTILKRP